MKSLILLALGAQAQDDPSGPVERYFFTTSTTTTLAGPVTTPAPVIDDQEVCWKCDAMSYNDCATNGEYTLCGQGEANACFYEIREVRGKLKQLCTGCKHADACQDLQDQNFRDVNTVDMLNDQCKPSYLTQRRRSRNGPQQSVCRTCSQTCRADLFGAAFCFGSIDSNVGLEFMIPFSNSAEYPGLSSPTDSLSLGIPTYAFLDGNLDDAACDSIEDFTHHNIYFNNAANGKLRPNGGDDIRTLDEMTYWALQGQTRTWWGTNLADVQAAYNARINAGFCVASGTFDATFQLSSCSSAFTTLAYP